MGTKRRSFLPFLSFPSFLSFQSFLPLETFLSFFSFLPLESFQSFLTFLSFHTGKTFPSFLSFQACLITPLSVSPPLRASRQLSRGESQVYVRQSRQNGVVRRGCEQVCLTTSWPPPTGVLLPPPWGHEQRPLPVAETGSCEWRSAPFFASARCGALQKRLSARGGGAALQRRDGEGTRPPRLRGNRPRTKGPVGPFRLHKAKETLLWLTALY